MELKQKTVQFDRYLQEQIVSCTKRKEQLLADERPDEAVFEQVRANIYDIFRSILSITAEKYKDDPGGGKDFFLLKMEQIPSNWQTSYQRAKEHGDTIKMQTEGIKLDTASRIKENFARIWEGEI